MVMPHYSTPLPGSHPCDTHSHGPAQLPAGLPPLATTALGDSKTVTPAPAQLGPSRHHDGVPVQSQASALPPLPKDSVLWAALTLGHYGLFHSCELVQPKLAEAGVPRYIHVKDVTPHFSRGHLHYVCIMLSSSKTDPFHQGCPIIISCTGTPVCLACEAWCILQQHQQGQISLDAPFHQIDSRALDHVTLVRHIKDIAAWLGLDPSRYSGHSLYIRGGLSQWQIKLLGRWNSQAYQVYIKQDPLACAGLTACMAANS